MYYFHGDRCMNITMSDNPPRTGLKFVECEMKELPNGMIKKVFKCGEKKASFTFPKNELKSMDILRKTHNVVHKLLEDNVKESKSYIEKEKHEFCAKKQYERLMEKLNQKK